MIKLIATDMDGTFLHDDKTYDVERFEAILKRLNQHEIKFVVASGNQYRLLTSKFPKDYLELTFISENGAHIISKEEDLVQIFQSHEDIEKLVKYVESHHPEAIVCLTGDKAAYIPAKTSQETRAFLKLHMPIMTEVQHLLPLPDDQYYKSVIIVPDGNSEPVIDGIKKHLSDFNLVPAASGYGSIIFLELTRFCF
ncbi:HAD hydrolase family protein [Streptococcus pluranimalium]